MTRVGTSPGTTNLSLFLFCPIHYADRMISPQSRCRNLAPDAIEIGVKLGQMIPNPDLGRVLVCKA